MMMTMMMASEKPMKSLKMHKNEEPKYIHFNYIIRIIIVTVSMSYKI